MAIKKTRTDAWEASLDEETRAKLYERVASLSYRQASLVAKGEFGLDLPPAGTFYRFLARMREEDCVLRLAKASQVSKEIAMTARSAPVKDRDLIEALQSMAAEAALSGDVKNATNLGHLAVAMTRSLQESDKIKIAYAKLEILEAEKAKAIDAAKEETLTDSERIDKIKSIFGLK